MGTGSLASVLGAWFLGSALVSGPAVAGGGDWRVSGPAPGELEAMWVEVLPSDPGQPGFVVMTTELTLRQWRMLIGDPVPYEDARCGSPECPALRMSGHAALWVANRLSDLEALPRCYELGHCDGLLHEETFTCTTAEFLDDCVGYRFPEFEEWLVAATAGTREAPCSVDDHICFGREAWFLHNSGDHSHPVAGLRPNAWGLYDMFGNTFEALWVRDRPSDGFPPRPVPRHEDPLYQLGGCFVSPVHWALVLDLPRFLWEPGYVNYLRGIRFYRTVPPVSRE